MKRIKTIALLLVSSAFLFAGCEKEIETSALSLDLTETAVIKMYLYAELDLNQTGLEPAPNGTTVIVSVDYDLFTPGASGSWIDISTINNGIVEISVPATTNGVSVVISPSDFTYQQVRFAGSTPPTILTRYWTNPLQINNVMPGKVFIRRIDYSDQEL